jgi:hypothetical protein
MKGITFNWGTGIFLFYAIFAGVLFYSVYRSTQYDHSLVVDNYYDYDLSYQKHYDRLENTASLAEPLAMQWDSDSKKLNLAFPSVITAPISGELKFYRPDDKSLDWALPIGVDDTNAMEVDLRSLPVGRWKVQVNWEAADKPYFSERIIDLR